MKRGILNFYQILQLNLSLKLCGKLHATKFNTNWTHQGQVPGEKRQYYLAGDPSDITVTEISIHHKFL